MADTLRITLLNEIALILGEMTGATSGVTFSRVLDAAPEGRQRRGESVLSVIDGVETYVDVVNPNKRDRVLPVELRAITYAPRDADSVRNHALRVLGDLEQVVSENYLWSGFAYATDLLSNAVDRDDTGDRTVDVSLFIQVRYRTLRTDPYARSST